MTWLNNDGPEAVALCLAMAVVIFILLRRSYRYFGRRRGGDSPIVHVPRPEKSHSGLPVDASAELMRQEVQLHERERDASARLDSKIAVLQHLIHQAQDAITRLEAIIAQTEQVAGGEAIAPHVAADTLRAHATADSTAISTHDRAIYALADQGLSAVTIAHHVGMPLGEIETILHHRKLT